MTCCRNCGYHDVAGSRHIPDTSPCPKCGGRLLSAVLQTSDGLPGRERIHFGHWESWSEQFDARSRLVLSCVRNKEKIESLTDGFVTMLRGGGKPPADWPRGLILRGDVEQGPNKSPADAVQERIPDLLQRMNAPIGKTARVNLEPGTEPDEHGWTAFSAAGDGLGTGRAKAYWSTDARAGTLEVLIPEEEETPQPTST